MLGAGAGAGAGGGRLGAGAGAGGGRLGAGEVASREMEVALATERLDLRPLSRVVAAAVLRDRKHAARDLGAEIPSDWPDPDLVKLLIKHADMTSQGAAWSIWPIIDRQRRVLVGDFTFLGPPSPEGKVGIAYFIVSGYRRRGYATEAGQALVPWAQQQPGVKFISAACAEDNEASIRTLRRIGFRQTGHRSGEMFWRVDPGGGATKGGG